MGCSNTNVQPSLQPNQQPILSKDNANPQTVATQPVQIEQIISNHKEIPKDIPPLLPSKVTNLYIESSSNPIERKSLPKSNESKKPKVFSSPPQIQSLTPFEIIRTPPPPKKEPEKLDPLSKLRKDALDLHNNLRAKHGVSPLKLSQKLNDMAQNYAKKLAEMGCMTHSSREWRKGAGENLYACWGKVATGTEATQSWYNEIKDYDFEFPDKERGVVGHFTQLVWKGSKEVGFGVCKSKKNGWEYLVANYYPAGNYIGEFLENVFPPKE